MGAVLEDEAGEADRDRVQLDVSPWMGHEDSPAPEALTELTHLTDLSRV